MISESDMTQIVNRVRSEFGASPPAWFTNQWQPFLGAGRLDNGTVPYFRADRAAAIAGVAQGVWTALPFDQLRVDTGRFFDPALSTTITFRNPGRYLAIMWVAFASGSGARYIAFGSVNLALQYAHTQINQMATTDGSVQQMNTMGMFDIGGGNNHLPVGGTIAALVIHNHPGALNINYGGATVVRVGNV